MRTTGPQHVLTVQLKREAPGPRGTTSREPNGTPVMVPCDVFPMSSDEIVNAGGVTGTDMRRASIFDREWPGDTYSDITFEGAKWEQVGPAVKRTVGQLTRHTRVVLRRIGDADG